MLRRAVIIVTRLLWLRRVIDSAFGSQEQIRVRNWVEDVEATMSRWLRSLAGVVVSGRRFGDSARTHFDVSSSFPFAK
jgi:hypothetical protein